MQIENNFVVPAKLEEVMAFFSDIPRVAKCVPGCEEVERISPTEYKAKMVLQLKLLKLKFDVSGKRTKLAPGHIEAVTSGQPLAIGGSFQTKLRADLADHGPGKTLVRYAMEGTMKGKLASIGEMVMKKSLLKNAEAFEKNVLAVFRP